MAMTTFSLQTFETTMLSQCLWVHSDGSFGLKVEGPRTYRSKRRLGVSPKQSKKVKRLASQLSGGSAWADRLTQ
eukprot:421830-Rhodomonas_salina.2